jgi:hypothetical protein
MKCVGLKRVDREHASIQTFGLIEPPSLVVPQSLLQTSDNQGRPFRVLIQGRDLSRFEAFGSRNLI